MHTTSSSFDEPLASALSARLDYANSFRRIPMLSNGAPKSFRNPVPIRNMATGVTDGMIESLGRIRREMHKVRSPALAQPTLGHLWIRPSRIRRRRLPR
ncbi:hypothetical protein FIBSPDRAFT_497114 [Athelia psychrophila]|uniref:Uncharacterized protein n=1 Tax=Athelia psychrophila TaxID=1759441 RepID=A0A166KD96_9AGAM|nr:hypothetical protein FIBSPDRAFT_497114 [Fibularhizoctonia sp. CBS 109695]